VLIVPPNLSLSRYPALRACSLLGEFLPAVARQLFNAAFVSCWDQLFGEDQDDLVVTIEQALSNEQTTNKDVRLVLLNLAEFMQFMHRGRLLVSEDLLGYVFLGHLLTFHPLQCQPRTCHTCLPPVFTRVIRRALRYSAYVGGAYAKSLHYKERELARLTEAEPQQSQATRVVRRASVSPTTPTEKDLPHKILNTVVDIIELNNALRLPTAAYGCVKAASTYPRVQSALRATAAASSLGQWDQILLENRRNISATESSAPEVGFQVISYVRCLDKLFKWPDLSRVVSESWPTLKSSTQYVALASFARPAVPSLHSF
jgi:hypothetical protein